MTKFEIGNTYSMSSPCDHNCIWTYTVTARTAQTVTLSDGNHTETVFPLGSYSMCPILTADKIF